ncbi:hypothetical protein glysoja_041854 [Glycine soja]|uniref:Uncharacterized protein n=1 Tax=Glycine soja TaxID=3848 RepID=A0A0B2P9V3_GLYSO|nr:hypothetical protein glysoja_041854 [Glycine soja]
MATRTLLKLKPNLKLPLRFFRNPTLALTRPVVPLTRPVFPLLARPESPSLALFKPFTVQFPGMIARQMATARSPRGASKRNEEKEEDGGDDDDDGGADFDDEDGFDLDEEFDGSDESDGFDDEEEEEKPKGKKKRW